MRRLREQVGQQILALVDPSQKKPRKKRRKRPGARPVGRPPKGPRSSQRHKTRPAHLARYPVHVTIRVLGGLGTLRRRDAYLAIREATFTVARHEAFRIVHSSLQSNHIHLLVEADDELALARGMQGFQISAAKHLNAAIGARTGKRRRRGQVFADRYNARALTSPRAVRHAICYVLNNWRRHAEDRVAPPKWKVDPFSTAIDFNGWKEREPSPFLYRTPKSYPALVTWIPKTWLLRFGWERGGPLISIHEVPGPERRESRATRS